MKLVRQTVYTIGQRFLYIRQSVISFGAFIPGHRSFAMLSCTSIHCNCNSAKRLTTLSSNVVVFGS